ncbi:co-chaperone DjlA [Legionella jordanis]|uniref:Co-chaperone protein DjlA n=1 Tax=Legionella jordanis TaxID=456 RepID=A0A0W0V970_9GAMM|nr:co-chaperone DjlA [Legionella jordanis]KTD16642.1 DNA binding protein DnaJ, heat shock protein [Legionella jordanis]RMX03823.1 co-chaperone DjlA [Legionella jordanis]RMX22115.1 co-chaperone DjlA [Legionella jordanis]VEH11894.1 DNA binding protein DnaJ, heat shock protein [Legionella jordanis]HAT8712801.1 co-chaperone DjlA [Legionella jordanis]
MTLRDFFTHYHWWGKILGGFFGYLIDGAAGALFGILIGNFFDRGIIEHFNRPHWHYYQERREAVQKTFFEATFAVMGYIAKADGRVSEEEIHLATSLMDEMRLNREQKTLAKHFFNQGKSTQFDLAEVLTRLDEFCWDNPELLKLFMDIQYRAVKVDLSEAKLQALDVVLRRLGFAPIRKQYRFYEDFGYHSSSSQSNHSSSSSRQQHAYQTATGSLAHAYALLEIDNNANKQEVTRAYRRLISRNHPDKLIAKGLPEQMIKMANDKTQKIRKAYEQICASRGW